MLPCYSKWPCSPTLRSAAVRLLGSRVRIPLRAWTFFLCVRCVGSALCDEMTTRSKEVFLVCVCVCRIVCDLETSTMRRPMSKLSCCSAGNKCSCSCVQLNTKPSICRTSGVTAVHIRNPGTSSGQFHNVATLTPSKKSPLPIIQRLGGPAHHTEARWSSGMSAYCGQNK